MGDETQGANLGWAGNQWRDRTDCKEVKSRFSEELSNCTESTPFSWIRNLQEENRLEVGCHSEFALCCTCHTVDTI